MSARRTSSAEINQWKWRGHKVHMLNMGVTSSGPPLRSASAEESPETLEGPPAHLVDYDYIGAAQPAIQPRHPPPLHLGRQTPLRQIDTAAAELAADLRRLLALQEQLLLHNAQQREAIEAAQRRQADAIVEIATVLRDAFGGGQQPRQTQGDSPSPLLRAAPPCASPVGIALFEHLSVFLELPGPPPVPWTNWKKVFQAHLEGAGGSDWNDARRASALVSLLGREGQRKYFAATEQEEAQTTPSNAASAPASDPDCSAPAVSKFDSLVKQLERLFAASTNPLVELHEFTSRRQLPGESFLDYVTVLKEKASDARVREKLLAFGEELSLEKAEEIGRTLEAFSLANHAFAPCHPENVEAVGQGAQDGGAKKTYGQSRRGGRDVTSTLPGSHNVTEVPASQDGDFQPQSSTGLRAPVPNEKFQGDFQPQSCDRCGSRRHQLLLYSASLRGELSTSYRRRRPPHI
ncbi:hypothetical protein HPB52_006296 [Rhipicephalus sanguineus]|uniref:Uncharacterized protein n=1 Tax=Rhipicephalus sanguineus TaxID=34632 RepID=A0A9D4PUU7_RHISA|nr:hypothetical protein HPB52_006296 [Rhipicephalus sanguineus]